ncbi:unnamed protein product [Rotaria magnacalcarata]|uniref:Uncharacterized protein n=1 Tax=Rotaria magnacalcarata TaxID=392030 RepID=A0A816MBQ0_9BILA|nr:unnamed protein product [Rotaria magnacalcarata]
MVAFAEVGATVAPSIGDDSDEEESSASAIESVDQELIRPLIHIVEEASGCVSTIEERLRATHSNESNQPASNGAVGGGGSWVLGNKTNLYPAIDCPGVNIVPNTCYFSGVLNNNGTTTLSNSSLSGVSNNSVIHSNSNVDTSTSNSCEVICNISTQYSNVAAATGINNSSIKCMDALNSKGKICVPVKSTRSTSENSSIAVATNNCINTLSNHSIERGARDENNFWGVENEPLSPPATMPAHTYTGWEQPEENSQNSQNSVSLNDGVCTPLYREQVGSFDPSRALPLAWDVCWL